MVWADYEKIRTGREIKADLTFNTGTICIEEGWIQFVLITLFITPTDFDDSTPLN